VVGAIGHGDGRAVAAVEPDADFDIVSCYAPHLLAGLVNHVTRAVWHDHPRGDCRSLGDSGLHLVLGVEVARPDDAVAHAFLGRVGHDTVHKQQPAHLDNAQDEHEEDNTYYCEFYEALAARGMTRAPVRAYLIYVMWFPGHRWINPVKKRRSEQRPVQPAVLD
jgi:hypothetical protein